MSVRRDIWHELRRYCFEPAASGGWPDHPVTLPLWDKVKDRPPGLPTKAGHAPRFDIGQRDTLISMNLASRGMDLIAGLGVPKEGARLSSLTARLTEGLEQLRGLQLTPAAHRSLHILGVRPQPQVPYGAAPPGQYPRPSSTNSPQPAFTPASASAGCGSPHVYNDETDIDRCINALARTI